MMTGDLKEKFIRETEQAINQKNEQMNDLLNQASLIEDEVNEHRMLLRLLKKGTVGTVDQPRAQTNGSAPPSPRPKRQRRKSIKISDEDMLRILRPLKEFTAKEAAVSTGMHPSSASTRLLLMQERGSVKMTKPKGRFVPRLGAEPARWKVIK